MSLLSASDDVSLGARIQLMAQAFQGSNAKLTVKTCVFLSKGLFGKKTKSFRVRQKNKPVEGCGISDNIQALVNIQHTSFLSVEVRKNNSAGFINGSNLP